jgi:hypothetical protein
MRETATDQFVFIVFVTTHILSWGIVLFLNKIDIIIDLSEFNILLWTICWSLHVLSIIELLSIMLLNHLQVTA